MDLLDKVEKITMTSLSIFLNTNLVPLAICGLPLVIDPKQHTLGVEEKLEEEDTSILTRRKKNRRKVAHEVVIKEVSTKVSNDNLLIMKSS
jgi:hypothetical protein